MPLSPRELDEFLAEPRLAHLATVDRRGRLRIRPVWFLWRDRAFWFTTRRDTRHTGRDVVGGSAVAVSIASDERPYRAVIASGRPEVLDKDEGLLLAISTRYGEAEGRRWTAHAMREPDRVVLRLVPDTLLSWHYGRGDYRRQDQGVSMRTVLPR
jgi:nitroimidazol reductase NimA-like FMN-containing flavoprotein (pyridoxamine 5'-phosphate oxidase superfamily)